MYEEYTKEEGTWPLIPLRGIWIFPHMVIHFDVGREISLKAVEEALLNDSKLVLLSQTDFNIEDPKYYDLYDVGTLVEIKQTFKMPNGNTRILVEGIDRVKVKEFTKNSPYMEARVEVFNYDEKKLVIDEKMEAVQRLCLDDIREYISLDAKIPNEIIFSIMDIDDPARLADVIVSYMDLKSESYYSILEEFDIYKRLEKLHVILQEELELARIEDEINKKVTKKLTKSQKEYILREQLNAIKSELGYVDEEDNSLTYKEKIEALDIEEESKEHLFDELKKLNDAQPGSPDISLIQNYLDTVLKLPWNEMTEDITDLDKSREILEKKHYALKDVKERILEFIAVLNIKRDLKGSIICLVGPPGVGKTSIASSIAEAIGREFTSMKLGGITDESEIRGHRKTYIGAMPGRIISAMVRAKSKNPVFLLDEIDKIGNDFRGDPSSALLEVLDPNQNDEFMDRYIEIPFDLSNTIFVTTANTIQSIPDALIDRMEIIRLAGYTEDEKFQIAKRHLLAKDRMENGLKADQVNITDTVIRAIIKDYTREAGVRELERYISKIYRRAAKKIVETGVKKVNVSTKNMVDFLGRKKFFDEDIQKKPEVGIVTGLAWTQVGGEILQIEVNTMKGTGKVQLTGSLGDVMKESAMAAISYIRANAEKLDIDPDFYQKTDLHVHVPEGATPKDGPSAGITITTAIYSALVGLPIRSDIAMTGEVTIRGRVLPIGGLKEKSLAANRYGIKNIIIPAENQRDLEDIAEEIREGINFYPVKTMDDVFKLAIVKDDKK